jgi:hypothetical protein
MLVFHDGANDDEEKHKEYDVVRTGKKNPAAAEKGKQFERGVITVLFTRPSYSNFASVQRLSPE